MTDWQAVETRSAGHVDAARVVLVSGWSFTTAMWSSVVAELTRRGLPEDRVHCVDWRKMGRWLYEPGGSCPVPDAVLNERAVWVGWSLGATLMLEAMGRNELRPLRALAISATPRHLADPDSWPGVAAGQWRSLYRRVRRDPSEALAAFDAWLGMLPPNSGRVTDTDDLCRGLDWLAEIDQRPLLAANTVPISWIYGAADPLVPDTGWPSRLKTSDANRWLLLPEIGHDVPWTQAARVASEII